MCIYIVIIIYQIAIRSMNNQMMKMMMVYILLHLCILINCDVNHVIEVYLQNLAGKCEVVKDVYLSAIN